MKSEAGKRRDQGDKSWDFFKNWIHFYLEDLMIRSISNYFKHFFSLLGKEHFKYISRNKANFDVNYNSTIAITSLYDLESG